MHFLAVQRELRDGDAELLTREPRVTQLGTELDDFADTAAVLASVDLVITVDTSVAQLSRARWADRFISSCPSRPTGVGRSRARIAAGIPLRDCSASLHSAIGTA